MPLLKPFIPQTPTVPGFRLGPELLRVTAWLFGRGRGRRTIEPSAGGTPGMGGSRLAFTRDSFTSRLLCTNQPCYHSPHPLAWSTLVQYDCTILTQYKTPLPTSRVYAIHHTILVITISCEGQDNPDLVGEGVNPCCYPTPPPPPPI